MKIQEKTIENSEWFKLIKLINSIPLHRECKQLYDNIVHFSELYAGNVLNKLSKLESVSEFRQEYIKEWEKMQYMSKIMEELFKDNKFRIHLRFNESVLGCSFSEILILKWRNIVFVNLAAKICEMINEAINLYRKQLLIKQNVCDLLNLTFLLCNGPDNQFWIDNILPHILDSTKRYYEIYSEDYFQNNNILDYAAKMCELLEREYSFFKCVEIRKKLVNELFKIVFVQRKTSFDEHVCNIIQNSYEYRKIETIYNIYILSDKKQEFQNLIISILENEIGKVIGDYDIYKTPLILFEKINNIYKKYEDICKLKNINFFGEILSTLSFYINTKVDKTKSIAYVLAECSDLFLRKGGIFSKISYDEIENYVKYFVNIINIIHDKDIFTIFYKKKYAYRLLYENCSEDYESIFLLKLKEILGNEIIKKMQVMNSDMITSQDLTKEFCLKNKFSFSFSMKVLQCCSWPIPQQNSNLNVPKNISCAMNLFEKFYSQKFNNRKLNPIQSLTRGELTFNVNNKFKNIKYTIKCTSTQIALLCVFNESIIIKKSDICSFLNISSENFDRNCIPLLKKGILIMNKKEINSQSLPLDTSFKVKENFSSTLTIVDCTNIPQENKEKDKDTESINSNRNLTLQATIVRILKTKKEILHSELINLTLDQISKLFKPSLAEIKKCISLLLEKEYMKKSDKVNFWLYIA